MANKPIVGNKIRVSGIGQMYVEKAVGGNVVLLGVHVEDKRSSILEVTANSKFIRYDDGNECFVLPDEETGFSSRIMYASGHPAYVAKHNMVRRAKLI